LLHECTRSKGVGACRFYRREADSGHWTKLNTNNHFIIHKILLCIEYLQKWIGIHHKSVLVLSLNQPLQQTGRRSDETGLKTYGFSRIRHIDRYGFEHHG